MKTNPIFIVALLGATVLLQTGCEPTKADRIKKIDAQLASWVSTGRSDDADKRLALRSERALLAADLGYSTSTDTPVSAPVAAATPVRGATNVVIAPASKEKRWETMDGESSWMDAAKQTHAHGGTVYSGGGYYYTDAYGRRVYTTNPR
jgi:hypothetical protein